MPRVLAFDAGMNLGWGALGGGVAASGCRRLRGGPRQMGATAADCASAVRRLLEEQDPQVVCFASPFVGATKGKPKTFIKGKPVWGSGFAAVPPDKIRPLFGCLTVIEMVVEEWNIAHPAGKIRCVEVPEPEARRAFLTAVPRKSKDIKIAVLRACRLRGWMVATDHAADALCVASYVLEWVDRDRSHLTTPLFA